MNATGLGTAPELREPADERGRLIVGRAPVYGALSEDLGGFREEIEQGAASSTVADRADILALYDHDYGRVLGRTSSGTLRLIETAAGVDYEVRAPDTVTGREVVTLLDRGDLRASSFGFFPERWRWEEREGEAILVVSELRLLEVSVVAMPAYPSSPAAARSAQIASLLGEGSTPRSVAAMPVMDREVAIRAAVKRQNAPQRPDFDALRRLRVAEAEAEYDRLLEAACAG